MIEDNYRAERIRADGAVIYCWGDEQRGTEGFSEECFEEMRNQFQKEKGVRLGLHLGDSFDWLRPTMRARVEGQLAHDPSARAQIDKMLRPAQDKVLSKMTPFEGRMLGVHEGHHTWTFAEGVNLEQRMASALRAPYLGWIGATRLSFQTGETAHHGHVLTLLSTHGGGNGTAVGSDARKIQELAVATVADLYVRGHSCKAMVTPALERRVIRRSGPPGVLKTVPWYVNTPGMCKSYTNGWDSSYAERAGYIPQPIGWIVIRIRVVNRRAMTAERGIPMKDRTRRPGGGFRYPTTLHVEATPVIFSDWGVE